MTRVTAGVRDRPDAVSGPAGWGAAAETGWSVRMTHPGTLTIRAAESKWGS